MVSLCTNQTLSHQVPLEFNIYASLGTVKSKLGQWCLCTWLAQKSRLTAFLGPRLTASQPVKFTFSEGISKHAVVLRSQKFDSSTHCSWGQIFRAPRFLIIHNVELGFWNGEDKVMPCEHIVYLHLFISQMFNFCAKTLTRWAPFELDYTSLLHAFKTARSWPFERSERLNEVQFVKTFQLKEIT